MFSPLAQRCQYFMQILFFNVLYSRCHHHHHYYHDVRLAWTLSVLEFQPRTSKTCLSSISALRLKSIPLLNVSLWHIQFVVILMPSEGKLSHLVKVDIISVMLLLM
jgi:hypothetical protein